MSEQRPAASDVSNVASNVLSGVVVQAGSVVGGVHVHATRREPVALPYRLGRVPSRYGGFQARAAVAGLVAALAVDGGVGVVADAVGGGGVLSGLGGVGKTQLTADYAHQVWDSGEVALLVWTTATDRNAIVAAYARVAEDLTGQVDADAEQGAERLLGWLAVTDQPWLLVLDDVRAPADLGGLWPPRTAVGRTVVTSRRRDAALTRHGTLVEVGVFTPEESAAYLATVLARYPHMLEGAGDLAEAVGHLPLALSQATAYLADRELTCAQYVLRFTDRQRRLAELLPEPDALPDEHQATVAVTWSLSIEHADRLTPAGLGRPLLQLCAVLDPNGIPLEVLTSRPVLDYLGEITGGPVTAERARDGLACLHRLNLITVDPATTHAGVRVHALVQRATRDHHPTGDQPLARLAADALVAIWPEVERDTVLAAALRANTTALHGHTGNDLWTPDIHPVLFWVGHSMGEAGQAAAARDHFTQLHTTATHLLGAGDPGTLSARSTLAKWRGQTGDVVGAAAAFADLLDDYLRVLGADHPDTLDTRSELAYSRGQTGDVMGAAAAFADLLDDYLRVLGADHLHTLATRYNLAYWRGEAGEVAEAAAAFADVLDDQLRVLGTDHLHTLNTRSKLAHYRGKAGDAVGTAAALAEVLEDQLRVLGADHPHTLATRYNLAYWRSEAGEVAEAVAQATLADLIDDQLRVLGADHPYTLITRHNLAYWRGETGDVAGAAAAFLDVLDGQLRVLGADHPHTLNTRYNLAKWRGEAGDVAGAIAVLAELLNNQLQVLGADHPQTLVTRHYLAYWQGKTNM